MANSVVHIQPYLPIEVIGILSQNDNLIMSSPSYQPILQFMEVLRLQHTALEVYLAASLSHEGNLYDYAIELFEKASTLTSNGTIAVSHEKLSMGSFLHNLAITCEEMKSFLKEEKTVVFQSKNIETPESTNESIISSELSMIRDRINKTISARDSFQGPQEIKGYFGDLLKKLQLMEKHLESKDDFGLVMKKVEKIRNNADKLEKNIATTIEKFHKWNNEPKQFKQQIIKTSSGKISIRYIMKQYFLDPLVRVELDESENVVLQTAADYLLLKFKPDCELIEFENIIAEKFPTARFQVKVVSSPSEVYELCMQVTEEDPDYHKLLDLFDSVLYWLCQQPFVQFCHPDGMFGCSTSYDEGSVLHESGVQPATTIGSPINSIFQPAPTQQLTVPADPWNFKAIVPPENLFDTGNPAVPLPTEPILVAVLDTGLRESHIAFANSKWVEVDEETKEELGFGFNSFNELEPYAPHDDDSGHGTHVSGIICVILTM